ncbi:ABC transporter ATP-binding protein [Nocardia abscessus]|uniref:ABC transporter ATP-binding protein n=1 Tax=Nocardia abscessus TaxID=120957 RepID=UPI0024576DC9|nr:ABC transporter ATP-binding protein [Nocardia abscessus]
MDAKMAESAIQIDGVSRVFRTSQSNVTALENVTFSVGSGEIVALLGENGAGKTTLTKILSTLLLPTSGAARVLGADVVGNPSAVRAVQSVVLGGDRGLYSQLSARENLRFFGMLDGLSHRRLMARLDSSLDEAGLTEVADRKVSTFSKGMRQRLHLAIGLLSEPKVLLLDEPTVGLDPVEAARLRASIAALRRQGVAVLLTSHYLLDVEELADRVIVLEKGRVTHEMTIDQFSASLGYAATVVVHGIGSAPDPADVATIDAVGVDIEAGSAGWQLSIRVRDWSPALLRQLGDVLADSEVVDMKVVQARLEDTFIRLHDQVDR